MSKCFFIICVALITAANCFAMETADELAIQKVVENYVHAWNANGGKGFADDFTDDASFVNIFGMVFNGREEIEVRHVKILETIFKNSTLRTSQLQLREISPGVVVALVKWKLSEANEKSRAGIFTQVFVQSGSAWKIAASQNTVIPNG